MATTATSRPRRTVRELIAAGDRDFLASCRRTVEIIRSDLERLAQLPEGHPDLIDRDDDGTIEVHTPEAIRACLEGCWAAPAAQRPASAWPTPDPEQIKRFLTLLGKPKGSSRLRAFLPKDHPLAEGDVGRKGSGDLQRIERWQADGRGVYIVIGNGGDTDREISGCPALFIEHDDRPKDWQVACWRELGLPEPSVQIDTGGRSIHSYWVLQEPMEPAAWRQLQSRLLDHADADRSLKNPSRVMRLPGCWHMGADGPNSVARIITESGKRYTPEQIAACLPEPPAPAAPAPAPAPAPAAPGLGQPVPLQQLLPRDLESLAVHGAPEGQRNQTAFTLACSLLALHDAAAAAGLPTAGTPEDALLQFASRCQPPLPDQEVRSVFSSACSAPRTTDPGWPERLRFQLNRQVRGQRQQQEPPRRQQQQGQAGATAPQQEQPTPQPAGSEPFRVLGWCPDRTRIHYQHGATGQLASIKPAAQAGPLLQLAPIGWWATSFTRGRTGDGIDWAGACSAVIEQADSAGVFAVDRVRGRGLWMEGSRTVWHLGDCLEVDGQEVELIEHRSAHHYPRLPKLDTNPNVPPLSDAEGREILKAVSAMGWATPLDPIHLLGWAVLANVGGALEKRPVLQITSRFGSGKTYTRERVLQPLLAGLAISRSNSTEAGIRQLLKADTLPVLIDESEGEDHTRREGHLRLARLSYDGSPTDRGTTHGQALSYAIRSSVALVGINAEISNPAERSRTVLVGREQLPQAAWAEVDRRLQELLTVETGARLLRRAVTNLPTLRANVATFRRVVEGQLGGGAAARAGDTYGALLAGAHLLTSTALVDDAQAIDWLDSIGWSAAAALGETGTEGQESTAESRKCLAHLLGHEEPWRLLEDERGTGRISVRELVHLARLSSGADDAEQARKALGRRGIRATDSGLEVANSAEALAPIYGKTKWRDGGHRARLLDLPGAYAAGMVRFPVLGACRASKVPWEVVA